MANTTNFGWETPDDTDLVKDGAAAIRTLGSAIDTSLVDLKGGTTGQVLSKASGTDMDFTWVAQDDSNAIQNAIVDAKGDLISATAADTPARLAVGTDGQVLLADSSTATGLKWGTASSGGLTLISTTTLSGASSIAISSIPTTYKNLRLIIKNAYGASNGTVQLRLNSDSNQNYARHWMRAAGGTLSASNSNQQTEIFIGYAGQSDGYNDQFIAIIDIPRYTDTSKSFINFTCRGYSFSVYEHTRGMAVYSNSAAITAINVINDGGNWNGGTAYLYGES